MRHLTLSAVCSVIIWFWLLFRVFLSLRHYSILEGVETNAEADKFLQLFEVHKEPLNLTLRDNHHLIDFVHFPKRLAVDCDKETNNNLQLLVIVLSSPKNERIRNSIRKTWANPNYSQGLKHGRAKAYFIVGDGQEAKNATQNEIEKYDDLIIVDVNDTYKTIVYKVFAILHIGGDLCTTPFILKVDEDVVFHIDRFLDGIGQYFLPDRADIYCHVYHEKPPIRIEWLEWYVSPQQFAGEIYPDFCAGPAYVMTHSAALQIMNNIHLLPDIQVEDVLVTGLISEEAGVNRIDYQHMFQRDNWARRKCDTHPNGTPSLIAKHGFKTHVAMVTAWNRLSAKECPHE